jgi:DNA primase
MGKEWRTRPIYRDSGNQTSLRIWKDSGRFTDFSAGISGDLTDLIKLTLNLPDREKATDYLKGQKFEQTTQVPKPKLITEKFYPKELLIKLLPETQYWENRGISKEVLKRFTGGLATGGKMLRRYIFPVYDPKGNILGFAGRYVGANRPDSAPTWKILGKKQNFLYPCHLNKEIIRDSKQVILVEGISDVLTLFQNGIENVMCIFGTSISPKLVSYLISLDISEVIISTNNEPDNASIGNLAAEEIQEKLSKFFSDIKICLPYKKDFNELTPEEIEKWKKEYLNGF